MNVADARAYAEDLIKVAAELNASYEHAPSKQKAEVAAVILDLCSQLEKVNGHRLPVPASDPVEASQRADGVYAVRVADATGEAESSAAPVRETILELD